MILGVIFTNVVLVAELSAIMVALVLLTWIHKNSDSSLFKKLGGLVLLLMGLIFICTVTMGIMHNCKKGCEKDKCEMNSDCDMDCHHGKMMKCMKGHDCKDKDKCMKGDSTKCMKGGNMKCTKMMSKDGENVNVEVEVTDSIE